MRRFGLLVGLIAVMAVATAHVVTAQSTPSDSVIEAQMRALALELRCPVCQGLSIGDSPSELAREMRGVIRDQLKAGRTPDEVRQYFVQKYGEWVLLAPKPEGFNLVVYIVPAVFILGGLFVVWRFIQRSSAGRVSESSGAPEAPAS